MNDEIKQKLEEYDYRLDAIYASLEKIRRYFLIVVWTSVIVFVIPLIGLIVAIPAFIRNYATTLNGLI